METTDPTTTAPWGPRSQPNEAKFFFDALDAICGIKPQSAKVLDLGCGHGGLVKELSALGVAAYGCEIAPRWEVTNHLRAMQTNPYRIPFDDESFDAVVSISVMEHVVDKRECFYEIRRVLKPGGHAMHLFPAKWYLPREPHIYVPLANYGGPFRSRLWFALWALLGVRNSHQTGVHWRTAVEQNMQSMKTDMTYWSSAAYERLLNEVFGNCEWPMRYFLDHAHGGYARLFRHIPPGWIWEWIGRETRTSFFVSRK